MADRRLQDAAPQFDVAIVGAGINGAGIARDAALRGLKVVIFDKNDMCSGTSAVSSRLIHGGLRYLEYAEIPLVYESLHERRYLRHIARHLVQPLRICIPIFAGARRGLLLIRLGMIAYDLLSFRKLTPNHEILDAAEIQDREPGLRRDGLRGAACYFDAQVTFAERLVLENLLAARSAGAVINTHCEVREICIRKGRVVSLVYADASGALRELTVGSIVNASGPWVDQVLKLAPRATKRFIGGTKGSHIIVARFPGAPTDAFYVEAAADCRPFFIIPWNGQCLIGTTDIRYTDDLDNIRASRAEIDYLLAETNRVFPGAGLDVSDIHFAYAGVRPLPYRDKGPESAITRRHIIKANRQVAKGLVSIIGGKLTTYRNLAEQTVDKLAKILRRKLPECRTHDTLLPGAWGIDRAQQQLVALRMLSDNSVERLLHIYGGRAVGICELMEVGATCRETLDDDNTLLAAEVVFTIRDEFAATLTDIVFRRMMIGFDPDQGRSQYAAVCSVAAGELGWTTDEANAQMERLVSYADSLREF
ncbi:MAG: glycerol-3-phosphate dehydrogenase/oxidase [Proteobacteria bacterium]|nr:glycerol-3-phosphate dehydrogenase/oxidase [Pseudomonadota bacterium]